MPMFIHDDEGFVGTVEGVSSDSLAIRDLNHDRLMHQELWGLKPRNLEQAIGLLTLADVFSSRFISPFGGSSVLALLSCNCW